MYDHVGSGDPRSVPGAPNSSSSTDNPGYTPSDGGGGGPGGGGAGPGGQQQTRYGANPPPPPNMGAMPPPDAYGSTASMQSTGSAWYGGDQRLPGIAQVAPNDLPRPMPHHLMTGPLPGQTHGHYITIFDVSPQQGFEGTVISISCELSFPPSTGPDNLSSGPSRVRFVMGNRIVETEISTPIQSKDPYILRAAVPSFSQLHAASTSVPMRLEAINEVHVFESVSLGDFHFLDDGGLSKRPRLSSGGGPAQPKREHDSPSRKIPTPGSGSRRRASRHEPYPTPAIAAGAPSTFIYDSPPPTPQPGLVRTTQMVGGAPHPNSYMVRTKARLEIDGDLNTMKQNWSPTMWTNRRCLVEFHRRQVGATVHASFHAIEEKDWTPNMIVISCLYHSARNECYFTSVDAIYLLECLMATRYTTEEKNRIRRNLESFKPTTLQKNEGQWQDFYAHIMSYPNPKPRNIDKGLKVFPWVHLEQALKKIFGNYSAFSSSPSYGSQYNYNQAGDMGQVTYAHTTHGAADAVNFTDDRAMVHQAATAAGDMNNYMDLGAGGSSGYRFMANSSGVNTQFGYPKSADPGLYPPKVDSGYPGHPGEASEFANYVNMSPTNAAPAYPRDYQSMAYASMPPPSDGSFEQPYGYPSDYGRGPSTATGDLRVSYDTRPGGVGAPGQPPPPPPPSNSTSQPHNSYPPPT